MNIWYTWKQDYGWDVCLHLMGICNLNQISLRLKSNGNDTQEKVFHQTDMFDCSKGQYFKVTKSICTVLFYLVFLNMLSFISKLTSIRKNSHTDFPLIQRNLTYHIDNITFRCWSNLSFTKFNVIKHAQRALREGRYY